MTETPQDGGYPVTAPGHTMLPAKQYSPPINDGWRRDTTLTQQAQRLRTPQDRREDALGILVVVLLAAGLSYVLFRALRLAWRNKRRAGHIARGAARRVKTKVAGVLAKLEDEGK